MSEPEQTQTTQAPPVPGTQRQVRTPGKSMPPAAAAVRTPPAAAAVQPPPGSQGVSLPDDIPNAIDIDPKTIAGPVLTKQGWVCPDMMGREQRGPR